MYITLHKFNNDSFIIYILRMYFIFTHISNQTIRCFCTKSAITLFVLLGTFSNTTCQPQDSLLHCQPGEEIIIDTVMFGRTSQSPCNSNNQVFPNLPCLAAPMSSRTVHLYCDHQSSCIVHATTAWLQVPDPCPTVSKYLYVSRSLIITCFTQTLYFLTCFLVLANNHEYSERRDLISLLVRFFTYLKRCLSLI